MPTPRFKVLVLSDYSGVDANVVSDFRYSFNRHSKHEYYYLHTWTKYNFRRLRGFDFNRFDAIILFWDFFWIGCEDPLSYCYVPAWVSKRIAESRALKIQFLQDEYRDVHKVNRVMNRFGVNVMFSCVAPSDQSLFYPKERIPSLVATYPVLTGYVPSYLEKVNHPAAIDRPIDIGYRSRSLPYHLGTLGREKIIIAERFQEIADRHGFTSDISVKEKDRIYGNDWLEFMKACRFSLGTESGASVVDFDGQIRQKTQDYLHDHPGANFDEVRAAVFEHLDGKVVVQTISPRIFEASAFENTLILHEGHYEGMLQPDVHYISVKKDYSNISDIVERMKDRKFCESLAKNAKEVLIESQKYSYRAFVRRFDGILESHVHEGAGSRNISRTVFYLMNYLNNDHLLPHRGGFLTIPRSCDYVHHVNKFVPFWLIIIYSLLILLDLVCQCPITMVQLILRGFARGGDYDISGFELLRNLRFFALLARIREAKKASSIAPFAVQLELEHQTLVAQNVAWASDQDRSTHSNAEGADLDALFDGQSPFSICWDTRATGSGLPLASIGTVSYCVYLNDDCIYRFEALNAFAESLTDTELDLIKRLLQGNWKTPSWPQRAWTLFCLSGRLAVWLLCEKPVDLLRQAMKRSNSSKETASP